MIDARAFGQGGAVRELLGLVYRRKFTILVPALLAAGIGWAIAATTPPHYTASAVLALDVRKVQVVEHEVVAPMPQENAAIQTELAVIGSRSLNEQVVDRLGLTTDPEVLREVGSVHSTWQSLTDLLYQALGRYFPHFAQLAAARHSDAVPALTREQLTSWIIGNLHASNDGRSLTIVVSFTSEDPERAARIANAVAQNYIDYQVQSKVRATMTASDWLSQQLSKMREQLENSEAAVDEFRRKSGLLQVHGSTIPADRLSSLNTDLGTARLDVMRAEVRLQTARASDPTTLPDDLATPTIQALRAQLGGINVQIAALQDHGAYYKLRDLEREARVLQSNLKREMNRIIASLTSEVAAARKRQGELDHAFAQMEGQAGDASHSGLRLAQLQREADSDRAIYETLLARYKQTLEQESLATPDARVISQAEPPGGPVYPNVPRSLALGAFFGVVIGGGFAFLREALDRRIRQTALVEAVTGIPVFGLLPKVSRWRRMQPQDYPVKDPHSRFCAALARVHTALRGPQSLDHRQVILVTSAQPGDGKTSFCTGLARSLARSRLRVLVIDADPYRARVAAAFGARSSPYFGPLAGPSVRLADRVQADLKSAAHFVPAPSEDDLHHLLHAGGFARLLDEARQSYDVVIIDTPPVMTSADAALIGRFADTRLLLVRWGQTSWDQMTAAVGFFRLCRLALDGIVVVGADGAAAGYGHLAAYDTGPGDYRLPRPPGERGLGEVE